MFLLNFCLSFTTVLTQLWINFDCFYWVKKAVNWLWMLTYLFHFASSVLIFLGVSSQFWEFSHQCPFLTFQIWLFHGAEKNKISLCTTWPLPRCSCNNNTSHTCHLTVCTHASTQTQGLEIAFFLSFLKLYLGL